MTDILAIGVGLIVMAVAVAIGGLVLHGVLELMRRGAPAVGDRDLEPGEEVIARRGSKASASWAQWA
jgi:hypothetical protein